LAISLSKPVGLNRGGFRSIDLISTGSVAGLGLIGLLAVYTATVDPDKGGLLRAPSELFNRQLVFAFIAGAVFLTTYLIDYRFFKIYAGVAYVANLILLLAVLTPLSENIRGSQRWIPLGLFKLQPSEFAKPVLLSTLAAYLCERRGHLDVRDIVRCVALTAPYTLLVFLQPDFGTMIVLASILTVTLVVAGADWRHMAVLLGSGALGVALLFNVGIVHDYQRTRLEAFLDPAKDPDRAGYNYRLTRQAVGNGGLFGKGILPKQDVTVLTTNLRYVPEQHTDFVFTVIAEQMGFVGGATLLGLYAILFVRGLRGAGQARDSFGTIFASGAVGYLALQVFVNIGMTLGLAPITGIPLPFVSYGGASLIGSSVTVGALLSVRTRRFAHQAG
jgi:rod shape determining protein RodA